MNIDDAIEATRSACRSIWARIYPSTPVDGLSSATNNDLMLSGRPSPIVLRVKAGRELADVSLVEIWLVPVRSG